MIEWRATVAVLEAMRSFPARPAVVLLPALLLAAGCELVAPLKRLPGVDAGDAPGKPGTIGGGPDADETGGGGSDAGDGPPPTVHCDLSMRFVDVVLVDGLNRNPGHEYRINLSPDELTAYLAAGDSSKTADLYVTTRPSRSDPFGPLVPMAPLNGSTADLSVSVTADGLTLFMDSNRSGLTRIYSAIRDSTDQPFRPPNLLVLEETTPQTDEFDPYVMPDGSALYFISNWPVRNAVHHAVLTMSERIPMAAITSEIDSPGPMARFPVVTSDQLAMYLAIGNSPYDADIWVGTRTSVDGLFDPPVSVNTLNTSDTEYPQWISPDGCRLYFSRTLAIGGTFTYVAERRR